jgi:hypothetical protein
MVRRRRASATGRAGDLAAGSLRWPVTLPKNSTRKRYSESAVFICAQHPTVRQQGDRQRGVERR